MVALICLALVSLVACGSEADKVQRQTVEVTRGDIVVSVNADGNISLPLHRKLTFGVSGTVAEVNVEQGDKVVAGQIMARLDTKDLEIAVRASEQNVKTGEQAVLRGELAIRAAEIDLETAKDNFRKMNYSYNDYTFTFNVPESLAFIGDAQRQLDDAGEMLKVGISEAQYWEIKQQLKQSRDNLEEAMKLLDMVKGTDLFKDTDQYGILTTPITSYWTLKAAQLQVEKAQLALDVAKLNLSTAEVGLETAKIDLERITGELEKAVITAPFDGVVALVDVKEGDKLSAMDYATRTIIELIAPDYMEVDAEIDEIDIRSVQLGQKTVIELDAMPDILLEGEVVEINPVSHVEAGIVLYGVTIGFDVPDGSGLRSGMSATVDIIINEQSNVLLVPSRAINKGSQGNPIVQVMVNQQIVERPVVPGVSDGLDTEIVEGLSEGEKVVVEVRTR